MIREPHEMVERWMELVHKRELEKILTLYDQKAILIPHFPIVYKIRLRKLESILKNYWAEIT